MKYKTLHDLLKTPSFLETQSNLFNYMIPYTVSNNRNVVVNSGSTNEMNKWIGKGAVVGLEMDLLATLFNVNTGGAFTLLGATVPSLSYLSIKHIYRPSVDEQK